VALKELLHQKRAVITEKWLDKTLATYPGEASKFFHREKNQFANPVGQKLAGNIKALFDNLIDGLDPDLACHHLQEIIQVRSVQDFTPSKAVVFVLLLKKAVREELGAEGKGADILAELEDFDSQVDQLLLFAIDLLVKSREQMYQLRVNEVKRRVATVLKRSGMFVDETECEHTEDHNPSNAK